MAYTTGRPHRLGKASEYLTRAEQRGRCPSPGAAARPPHAGGLALLAGSVPQRFGTFEAGVTSTKDPACVVKPQRERLQASREGPDEQ
ncbi:hypothetical protein [Streptomyces sp. NPDC003480]